MIRRIAVLGLAGLAFSLRVAEAGESSAAGAPPPAENSSYVPDDHDDVRREWAAAHDAIEAKDFTTAVRALQRVASGPADAVVAAGEAGVFEGVEAAAHLRVLSTGAGCLDAYEREFGGAATAEFTRAIEARDERRLASIVRTYRPCAVGRKAALLLADLALERTDSDQAFEWLDGLEDLEDVAAPDLATSIEAWRTARRLRVAGALTKDTDAAQRAAALLAAHPDAAIARADRVAVPMSDDWPTTGGDATRSRITPALGPTLRLVSSEWLGLGPAGADAYDDDATLARPSLWIPTRAVVSSGLVFVSDGRALRVFDAETGSWRLAVMPFAKDIDPEVPPPPPGNASRRKFGWIEGHGLTVDGRRIYVTRTERRESARAIEDESRVAPDESDMLQQPTPKPARRPVPADRISAFDLVDGALVPRWEQGGGIDTPGLASGMRLFGTPLLYRGSLHVVGLRPSGATRDRLEAWHVALDPATGAVRSATFLGAGGPLRRGRDDEAMPASCAAAHGRVILVTSIGIAAAVDASSGRTRWSWRYDRGRPDGDDLGQRLDDSREETDRRTSFANEPPIIVDGRCFLTPTDARHVFALADRPRGRARALRLWRRQRVDDFRNLAVEQLVAVVGAADTDVPTLVLVGKGHELEGSPHTAVVALDPATGTMRWERALPFSRGPEPYGRALVTAEEVYVSTRDGIARYRLRDGETLALLDTASVARDNGPAIDAYGDTFRPVGNLVPLPGKGIVAVNTESISIWRKP